MKFTYFKSTGLIHFNHDGFDDYDGDEGYSFDYEVDDLEAHMAIAEFIYEDYLIQEMPKEANAQSMINHLWQLASDFDLFDLLAQKYSQELHDYFEQEALESVE